MTKPLLTGEAAEHIERLWPEHAKHLSPPGNTMGRGHIDPDEGVVCNCGEVLGYPTVQDESDYVAQEPDKPDTSGVQTGEPDDGPDDGDLPDGWQEAAAAGWAENPVGQAYAMGYAAGEKRGPQADQMITDDPAMQAGPLAQGLQQKSDTIDALWNHPDTQAVLAANIRDEEMRAQGIEPSDHRGEELTAVEAGWNDMADEAQDGPPWDTSGEYHEDTAAEHRELEPPVPPKGIMPYRDPGVVPAEDPLAARVVVIDPTQPYTPLDVERQLLDIEGRLERGMHAQRYWEEREFAAESGWTQKAARIRLEDTGGAKDIRDARVQVRCEEEWRELLLCRAMVRAMRETMHTLRSLQTGYQSVLRSAMESMRQPATNRRTP